MALSQTVLYAGTLGDAAAPTTCFTVAANTKVTITEIIINNTNAAAARALTIRLGTDAAAKEIKTAQSIAAGANVIEGHCTVLNAADICKAWSDVASELNLRISGLTETT